VEGELHRKLQIDSLATVCKLSKKEGGKRKEKGADRGNLDGLGIKVKEEKKML